MEQVDFRGSETRNAQQFDEPRGNLGTEFLEIVRRAGCIQVANDRERRWADTWGGREGPDAVEVCEVVGVECGNGATGLFIRADLEGAGALELEEGGDLREDVGGGAGVHS